MTPARTSVEADFSQVFAARFFDASGKPAAGEVVQFSNDACGRFANGGFVATATADANGVASMPFTAMQPGGTVCTVVASAGAQVRYQVFTYRLSQVTLDVTVPEHPLAGEAFDLLVRARMGAYALPNVDLAAAVVAKSGGGTISPGTANTGTDGQVTFRVAPGGSGDFDVEVSLRALTKRVPIRLEAPDAPEPGPRPHEDMWYSGPSENGWGLSIVEHRDILFVVIYAYDDAGRPTWYVISNGTWNGNTYTGAIHQPRGTPYYAYDTSRLAMGAPVGSATITFHDADRAALDYSINGTAGSKSITRFLFGPPAAAPMTGRGDMWWGGVAQSGWGLSVIQQGALLFVMWYTYDAEGRPTWFTMPAGAWTSADTYEGRLYRTTSSPWLGRAYDPGRFQPVDAGAYRLRFTATGAIFEYSVDGRTGTLPLTRFAF